MNGFKFELFIFDVFRFSKNFWALEVDRDAEFAPLKNAPGAASDTPEACCCKVNALHSQYLKNAGAILKGDGNVEIDPALSRCGEGLEPFKGKEIVLPCVVTRDMIQ